VDFTVSQASDQHVKNAVLHYKYDRAKSQHRWGKKNKKSNKKKPETENNSKSFNFLFFFS